MSPSPTDLHRWPHRALEFTLPVRYHLTGGGPGVVICLHGYQDHAASMLRRLGWLDRADLPFRVLGVNAPFPVPIWTANGFTEAYAWYFRDATRGVEVVGPKQAAAAVARLVRELDLGPAPSVIFGFSQGAYLAPFLARELENPRAIVGLGGGFPAADYLNLGNVAVYGVHGTDDERLPIDGARAEHVALVAAGFKGHFTEVPRLRHRVTAEVEPLVRRLAEAHLVEGS